jgi:hypothetical protein
MRTRHRAGFVPWTEAEREILQHDLDARLTAAESRENLPGRTLAAVETQRSFLRQGRRQQGGEDGPFAHTSIALTPKTYRPVDQCAEALGVKKAVYLRRLVEQVVDGTDASVETQIGRALSKRAHEHLTAEAIKRGINVPELVRRVLEAIAESQLTNAVLDDRDGDTPATRIASA